jgi:hypothetical protein
LNDHVLLLLSGKHAKDIQDPLDPPRRPHPDTLANGPHREQVVNHVGDDGMNFIKDGRDFEHGPKLNLVDEHDLDDAVGVGCIVKRDLE